MEAASLMRFTRRGTIKLMGYSAAWAGQEAHGKQDNHGLKVRVPAAKLSDMGIALKVTLA